MGQPQPVGKLSGLDGGHSVRRQFHNPKDLAISICLEAAELLEVFQWSAEDVQCEDKKNKIREELADVLNYCILMADVCGLDMDEIVLEKIKC